MKFSSLCFIPKVLPCKVINGHETISKFVHCQVGRTEILRVTRRIDIYSFISLSSEELVGVVSYSSVEESSTISNSSPCECTDFNFDNMNL